MLRTAWGRQSCPMPHTFILEDWRILPLWVAPALAGAVAAVKATPLRADKPVNCPTLHKHRSADLYHRTAHRLKPLPPKCPIGKVCGIGQCCLQPAFLPAPRRVEAERLIPTLIVFAFFAPPAALAQSWGDAV